MSKLRIEQGVVETSSGRRIMNELELSVQPGDFITVLGGNGAGKSTLFNVISGQLQLTSGDVAINNQSVKQLSEEKRAKYVARVFQDPKQGTAPRMTVEENLALAGLRGQRRGLRITPMETDDVIKRCIQVGNGLEHHLKSFAGDLSGGQRQALSLIMTTLTQPDILLLDEHTAALDPKTAQQLMLLTQEMVTTHQLTCLMITHRMEDALIYGNRLLVLENGAVVADYNKEEKEKLSLNDLLGFF